VGAPDLSKLSDDQLEILAATLEKRTDYEAFCFDSDLFGDETPAKVHRLICQLLQMVLDGEMPRLMLFAPPGTAKSTYVSKRAVAFAMGYKPGIKLIGASHTAGLAAKHGKESRNLIASPAYRQIFPEVGLAADTKARDDWATTDGGEFFGVGFDGPPVGRRADGVIIDDPFKGRKDADSLTIRESHWETYRTGLRSRLRKNGWIILMHQRWHEDDIAGRILPEGYAGESGWITARDGEEWFVANLQMVCETGDDLLNRKPGDLLWPQWFDAKRVKRDRISVGERNWSAMYQGVPRTDDGAILRSDYWRKWPGDLAPICEAVIQCYDTAFEEDEENDYSARTTWGVFDIYEVENAKALASALDQAKERGEEVQRYHAILLEAWRGKVPFHTLKKTAKDAFKEYEPDRVLIEKKASGHSLIQELKRASLPVKAIGADKSKTTRTHAAEPAFEQGCVWHMDAPWAQIVIRESAAFPTGKNDDLHDTVVMAINYLRARWHLQLAGEQDDEDDEPDNEEAKPIYG